MGQRDERRDRHGLLLQLAGRLSVANSYVGLGNAVTVLSNGNYVVDALQWNSSIGAVTWGSGTAA